MWTETDARLLCSTSTTCRAGRLGTRVFPRGGFLPVSELGDGQASFHFLRFESPYFCCVSPAIAFPFVPERRMVVHLPGQPVSVVVQLRPSYALYTRMPCQSTSTAWLNLTFRYKAVLASNFSCMITEPDCSGGWSKCNRRRGTWKWRDCTIGEMEAHLASLQLNALGTCAGDAAYQSIYTPRLHGVCVI